MTKADEKWEPFDDRTAMQIIAQWLNRWFLFDDKGQPKVIKRYRVKHVEVGNVRYEVIEEICTLMSDDDSMTRDARDFLRLSWGEHTSWKEVNR
jgi:hypothetical protein